MHDFSGTLAEDLLLAKPGTAPEELRRALEAVESCPHGELLAHGGRYAHLWEAWNSSLSRN
ncbi:hypothetical protein IRJ34_01680 [Paenarthrobacter sp. GOM3]|uniref:hypothetical protein n=1 Tax=Paenarthrobacter sp. GOM3 TaxID=2782567 RepID=UPI002012005E|nr:hypothetical protein [Paenarthrobacter sp. GOM3]WOH19065.1 hypothetical protein IRJ34_01680 [Paenarthrobacter sp. GOM3]